MGTVYERYSAALEDLRKQVVKDARRRDAWTIEKHGESMARLKKYVRRAMHLFAEESVSDALASPDTSEQCQALGGAMSEVIASGLLRSWLDSANDNRR